MLWEKFMNKKEADQLTNDLLIADALLRLRALEKLLIAKGVFSAEEISEEIEQITAGIAKSILQKANIPGNLDELIAELQGPKKKTDN